MKVLAIVIAALMMGGDNQSFINEQEPGGIFRDSTTNFVACDVDPNGEVYVINSTNNQIVTFSSENKIRFTTGGYGWSQVGFDQPYDVIAPNGLNVYVADYGNHRVQLFDGNLNFVSSLYLRDDPDQERRFGYPTSVAVDRFGALYILDGENKRILKIKGSNEIELSFGGIVGGSGQLKDPSKIRISNDDVIYVQDGGRVVLFDIFGNYLRTLENIFSQIRSMTVDHDTLYVLDSAAILTLTAKGAAIHKLQLRAESGIDWSSVRDIAVQGDVVWILYPHELIKRKLHEIIISIR